MTQLSHVQVAVIVRSAEFMPDGTAIKLGPKALLGVLASYWPNIYPSQDRLARQCGHVDRRTVNKWLREIKSAGLIWTTPGRSGRATRYSLNLALLRQCAPNGQCDPTVLKSVPDGAHQLENKGKSTPCPCIDDEDQPSGAGPSDDLWEQL